MENHNCIYWVDDRPVLMGVTGACDLGYHCELPKKCFDYIKYQGGARRSKIKEINF